MKHIITKDKFGFHAYCQRPGCGASLEGYLVEAADQEWLDSFFTNPCPSVSAFSMSAKESTDQERIAYIIDYAKKQMVDWQAMIDYWNNIEKKV